MKILYIKLKRFATSSESYGCEETELDLRAPRQTNAADDDYVTLTQLSAAEIGAALYGRHIPSDGSYESETEAVIEFTEKDGSTGQCSIVRKFNSDGDETSFESDDGCTLPDELLSASAFLQQTSFESNCDGLTSVTDDENIEILISDEAARTLYGDISSLSCGKFIRMKREAADPQTDDAGSAKEMEGLIAELAASEAAIDAACDNVRSEWAAARTKLELRAIEEQRDALDKEMTLFAPMKQRLERGRRTLELGAEHAALRDLRQEGERTAAERQNISEGLIQARADSKNADEAFSLMEAEYRNRLVEHARTTETIQAVRELDKQIAEHREAAAELREKIEEANRTVKDSNAKSEAAKMQLERLNLSLREARKYIQANSADEKLLTALPGIRKCFDLCTAAQEKRAALHESYDQAIARRQQSQMSLGDRQAMFSDTTYQFTAVEKNCERAQAFFESSLKGKTLSEWRSLCEQSERQIEELDALSARFAEERDLKEKLRATQDERLRIQQDLHDLRIKDVESSAELAELQEAVRVLERRAELMRRLEAAAGPGGLDELRELLLDTVACPLCGSASHPYAGVRQQQAQDASDDRSAAHIIAASTRSRADDTVIYEHLSEAQGRLSEALSRTAQRRVREESIESDISAKMRSEDSIKAELKSLGDAISAAVSPLGLKFGIGVSPIDEIDHIRQKERDKLQRSRNILEAAEEAERALTDAKNELERIRESREELTRYHQEAVFRLQNDRVEERRIEEERRSHEEAFGALKRELVSQISPFGYKHLPDEDPASVIDALETRMNAWREQASKKDALEREICAAQSDMTAAKKENDALKLKLAEMTGMLKSEEAAVGSLSQQRIAIFASKDPDAETERMNRDIEETKLQLDARRAAKNESAAELEAKIDALHDAETRISSWRDRIQRDEISFGKHLLAAGFKNEDDYVTSCLSDDERADLQEKLSSLTKRELELTARYERKKSEQINAHKTRHSAAIDIERLTDLNNMAGGIFLSAGLSSEADRIYREFADRLRPRLIAVNIGSQHSDGGAASKLAGIFSAMRGAAHADRSVDVRRLIFECASAAADERLKDAGFSPLRSCEGPLDDVHRTALMLGLSDLFAASERVNVKVFSSEKDARAAAAVRRFGEIFAAPAQRASRRAR